jgi:hypothetical protein
MTDSMPRSAGHRWLRKAIPAGIAVLVAAGVTAGPALAATAPAIGPAARLEPGAASVTYLDHDPGRLARRKRFHVGGMGDKYLARQHNVTRHARQPLAWEYCQDTTITGQLRHRTAEPATVTLARWNPSSEKPGRARHPPNNHPGN